jgi:hypothetical protein
MLCYSGVMDTNYTKAIQWGVMLALFVIPLLCFVITFWS